MMLLDTCVLLWLAGDPSAISKKATQLMSTVPLGLCISAISAFEIGQKAAAGKLSLSRPVDEWFAGMLQPHALHELPISGLIAARATLLPGIHRDPFDRLLIATAQQHNLGILTPDTTIAKYPNLKVVW